MVENESKRYAKPIIVTINTNTNNLFSRIEKERIKRKARRYPSYGQICGKYPTFNFTHLPHEYPNGKYLLINKNICKKEVAQKYTLYYAACNFQLPAQGGTCSKALLCTALHKPWHELQRASTAFDAENRKKK